ncbi:hypothetical protein AB0C61_20545 [Streptomyces sp. NPDC048680]
MPELRDLTEVEGVEEVVFSETEVAELADLAAGVSGDSKTAKAVTFTYHY